MRISFTNADRGPAPVPDFWLCDHIPAKDDVLILDDGHLWQVIQRVWDHDEVGLRLRDLRRKQ